MQSDMTMWLCVCRCQTAFVCLTKVYFMSLVLAHVRCQLVYKATFKYTARSLCLTLRYWNTFPLPTVPSKWLLLDCVVARPWNNVFCWTSLVTDVSNPHRLEEYILLVLFHSTLYEYSCWHTLVPCRKSLHHTLWTLVICMCNVVIIIHTLTLRAERCTLEAILLEKPNKVCSLFHGSFMMK